MLRIPKWSWLALSLAAGSAAADDDVWTAPKEPIPVSKPAVAPAPMPQSVPKVAAIKPTESPSPAPAIDGTHWLPARRFSVAELTPSPAPLPAPPFKAVESDEVPAFSAATPLPLPLPIPIPEAPAPLPPIKPNEKSTETVPPLPSTDKLPPKGDLLPIPKPTEPGPTKPSSQLPTYTVKLNDSCPPADPLLPPPGQPVPVGSGVVPVRNKVFGSPILNLSRDYHIRDLFGLDLAIPSRVGSAEAGGANDLFWVNAELLLWWQNRARIPVLATTSTSNTGSGFLGDAETRTLFGPGNFGPSFLPGFRVRAGGYLDECGLFGLDGGFFFLGPGREKASFDSSQFPIITRPFFAPNIPGEFGEVVARPGLSTGRFEIEQESYLWGIDINIRRALCRDCTGGRGWFLGYRHLNLAEQLSMTEFLTASGDQTSDPIGTRVVVNDTFKTRNRFHGPQFGWWWNRREGIFDFDARASVALGATNQIVQIDGSQMRTRPGEAPESFRGGLLATGPNLGEFRKTVFSVVPEISLNVGVFVLPNLRVYAGYNFLYWSGVVRPGDQIDRTVDLTLVPNPPAGVVSSGQNRPLPTFTKSDYWAQGVQLGVELRW